MREVGQLGAEGGGQVVAAALDQDEVQLGELLDQAVDGLQVDRGVLADGGVRAAARLHADDALDGQRPAAHQELRVLLGVDVVGDGGDVVASRSRLQSASISAVLPEPTGPATPPPAAVAFVQSCS